MPDNAAAVLDRPIATLLSGKDGVHTQALTYFEQGLGSPFNNWEAPIDRQVDPLTVRDVLRWPRKGLLDLRQIGSKSLDALNEVLRPYQLQVGQGPEQRSLSVDTRIGHVTYPSRHGDVRVATFLLGHALASQQAPKDVTLRDVLVLTPQQAQAQVEEMSWRMPDLSAPGSLIHIIPFSGSSDMAVDALQDVLSVFRLRLGMDSATLRGLGESAAPSDPFGLD